MVRSTFSSFPRSKCRLGNIKNDESARINHSSEKLLGTPRIEPGAAGWETRTLPLCYAATPTNNTLPFSDHWSSMLSFRFLTKIFFLQEFPKLKINPRSSNLGPQPFFSSPLFLDRQLFFLGSADFFFKMIVCGAKKWKKPPVIIVLFFSAAKNATLATNDNKKLLLKQKQKRKERSGEHRVK